ARAGFDRLSVRRLAPQQDVVIGELDFGHAATDRFENLRDAELGNEQTEGKPRRAGRRDVTARPDAPLDEPSKLKFAQRAVDRQAGRRERPNSSDSLGSRSPVRYCPPAIESFRLS